MENNYQILYDNQDYEKLVKETDSLKDLNTIRYHIIGLLGMGAQPLVLRIMLAKLHILKPVLTMFLKIHHEILKQQRELPEHALLLEAYENLPYLSQETDEWIMKIRQLYLKPSHVKTLTTVDIVIEAEKKNDEAMLIDVIPQLKAMDVYQLKTVLKSMLLKTYSQHLKGLIVLALIHHRYDEKIDMQKGDQLLSFNPIDTVDPFQDGTFETYKLMLDEHIKDPSVRHIGYSILSTYLLKMIPFEIDIEYYFIQAIRFLTAQYLKMPMPKADLSDDDVNLIHKKKMEIEAVLKT
jgi:hypothetical protein